LESGLNNFTRRRARGAKGFVLLLLLAHAFFVSATHFHRVAGLDSLQASGAALSRSEEGYKTPLANGEEQCLACRLQRNFNNGLMHHAAPEVAAPVVNSVVLPSFRQASAQSAHTLSATGRSPPLS